MILLVHMLFGAAVGSIIKSIPLAVVLAFLSHYFLDLLPHIEYPIENIKNKQWQKSLPEFLKVALDFLLGVMIILMFSNPLAAGQEIIFIAALFSILPDGFNFLKLFFSNKLLKTHYNLHEKIHLYKNKKIPIFWRIASQAAAIIISIILFNF